MKNRKNIKVLFFLFIGLFTMAIASGCSCTSSMCSDNDIANIKKSIEKNNIESWRNSYILSGKNIESDEYKAWADNKVEELYPDSTCGQSGTCSEEEILAEKANIKNTHNNEWLNALEELNPGDEGYIETRSSGFKEEVNNRVEEQYKSHAKACLVVEDDIDPETGAKIEAKKWKDAWNKGLLEGLIVYPISWLLSVLTTGFGGGGAAQIFAILIAVIIIRTLMIVLNFRGQIGTIKMQSIQGEVSAISEKLKDSNLTQSEKQALSMKMMDIYKKNDIHPISSLLTQFISFPIFIAVWAAMNQTLAIRKGVFLGLKLGTQINTQVFRGNIAAIVLFALMIVGQIITMRMPTWLRKRKEKKKNPNLTKKQPNSTEKQMNTMMFFMIGLIVVSGFLLPAALIVYWFFGSVFSIFQTMIFSSDWLTSKLNGLANRKKKAKVVK